MELTIDFIWTKFKEFNELYFENSLKVDMGRPKFVITKSKRMLGRCCCRANIWNTNYTIELSNYYVRDEYGYCQTLLHEMIHLYIFQERIRDTSSHGQVFKRIARQINRKGGYDISTTTILPKGIEVNPKYVSNKPTRSSNTIKTYNVCIIKQLDGKIFMFVANKNSISYIDNLLKRNTYLNCWEWFTSNDSMYDKYRVCRTRINGKYITENEYQTIFKPTKLKEINVFV